MDFFCDQTFFTTILNKGAHSNFFLAILYYIINTVKRKLHVTSAFELKCTFFLPDQKQAMFVSCPTRHNLLLYFNFPHTIFSSGDVTIFITYIDIAS